MYVLGLIFSISVSFLFIFSGFLKLFAWKESAVFMEKIDIIPKKIARPIGLLIPFVEIAVAVLLLVASNNILVFILTAILIVVLISINFKAVLEKKQTDCFCLGKLINTKTGYGGLVQCFLLLLSIIPSFLFSGTFTAFDILNLESIQILTILATSILWTISLITIRKVIEILYAPANG